MLKPSVGLTPAELGQMFYELACGGMHVVHDAEIFLDLPICPTEERLAACLKAGERAKAETGQMTLYAINLTGPVSKMVTKAKKLAKQGAQCFLFSVLSYGYGLLEELKEVGVPILVHPALAGALCGSSETGMSYSRCSGLTNVWASADMTLIPSATDLSRYRSKKHERFKMRKLNVGRWIHAEEIVPCPLYGRHPPSAPGDSSGLLREKCHYQRRRQRLCASERGTRRGESVPASHQLGPQERKFWRPFPTRIPGTCGGPAPLEKKMIKTLIDCGREFWRRRQWMWGMAGEFRCALPLIPLNLRLLRARASTRAYDRKGSPHHHRHAQHATRASSEGKISRTLAVFGDRSSPSNLSCASRSGRGVSCSPGLLDADVKIIWRSESGTYV